MELTTELVTAVIGGLTAAGAGLLSAIRWAVAVGREEAQATRDAHKDSTRHIIDAQKERDEAERELQRGRDAASESRYRSLADESQRTRESFDRGLQELRAAYDDRKAS